MLAAVMLGKTGSQPFKLVAQWLATPHLTGQFVWTAGSGQITLKCLVSYWNYKLHGNFCSIT